LRVVLFVVLDVNAKAFVLFVFLAVLKFALFLASSPSLAGPKVGVSNKTEKSELTDAFS
jgi:hypothetical protein